jgi:hypothetical protein
MESSTVELSARQVENLLIDTVMSNRRFRQVVAVAAYGLLLVTVLAMFAMVSGGLSDPASTVLFVASTALTGVLAVMLVGQGGVASLVVTRDAAQVVVRFAEVCEVPVARFVESEHAASLMGLSRDKWRALFDVVEWAGAGAGPVVADAVVLGRSEQLVMFAQMVTAARLLADDDAAVCAAAAATLPVFVSATDDGVGQAVLGSFLQNLS